jgi:hypothetical protein
MPLLRATVRVRVYWFSWHSVQYARWSTVYGLERQPARRSIVILGLACPATVWCKRDKGVEHQQPAYACVIAMVVRQAPGLYASIADARSGRQQGMRIGGCGEGADGWSIKSGR